MASSHSWERPAHRWDSDDPYYGDDSGSDSDYDPEKDPLAAAMELADLLLDQYMSGKMSAKQFCVTCYYAHLAGVGGPIKLYGLRPGASSGNYQKHLDVALGLRTSREETYNVPCVGSSREDGSRVDFNMPILPLHELAQDDFERDTSLATRLDEAKEEGRHPRVYMENPIVQASEDPVVPMGLYFDGVPYTATDTVTGVWGYKPHYPVAHACRSGSQTRVM